MEASVRSARWAIRAVPVVTVLVGLSGCGLMHALAHPPAPEPEPVATATAAPTPEAPPGIVDGDLRASDGGAGGRLAATPGEAPAGVGPPASSPPSRDLHPPPPHSLPGRIATPPGL